MIELQTEYQYIVILIIVVGFVYLAHMIYVHMNSKKEMSSIKDVEESSNEDNSDVIMYGNNSCPWCKRQKEELNDLWDNVKYVNCENNPELCEKEEISALPTWVIRKHKSEGFMKKDEFIKKCEL